MMYKVVLELAHSREYPNGSRACVYELQLPLAVDQRLDYCACRRHRYRDIICRFRAKEERRGELKCDHRGWFFAFGHGEETDAEILGCTRFVAGEWIPITGPDGQTRHFRVVEVDRMPRRGDPASLKDHPCSPVINETSWKVGAADDAGPRGAGAPRPGEVAGAERSQRSSAKTTKSPVTVDHVARELFRPTGSHPKVDRFEKQVERRR